MPEFSLRRRCHALACMVLCAVVVSPLIADQAAPRTFPMSRVAWPGADHDPSIPTAAQVLGYEVGAEMATHAEVRRYFDALAAAAPERIKLFDIGESWQGRGLFYAVVSSPRNLARLEEIRSGMQRLGDPRRLAAGEADRLIANLPAVVWIGHSIHGNEPGTTDAALATTHHLLASRGDPRIAQMLEQTVVIIAPLINPDGRERFIHGNRSARGIQPDPHPLAAERDEPWPGGRMNHYVFDMNRDWFTQTQPEVRAHARAMLEWLPVMVVDVHEMGTDRTFFFPPKGAPANPHLTATQRANGERIGRNNAAWFDRFGLSYFTREIFDDFFPGYGSGWPSYQGASGLLYEQGSSRGLLARRSDGTLLSFADTVFSQFVASLSAIEVVAGDREGFLRDFAAYRSSAVEEGRREPIKAYVLSAEPDRGAAARLAVTLARNGIEVRRVTAPFAACGGRFPADSYVIESAQPTKRLIRTLLDEQTPMDADFIARQTARIDRGLPDEIYDVTAWSLPLMANVPTRTCATVPTVPGEPVGADWELPGTLLNPTASVAFIVRWGDTASARFLAQALRAGVDVQTSNKPFTVAGVRYPAGSLVIPAAGQNDLAVRLMALATATGAVVTGIDTGWVTEGPGLGSPSMLHMSTPAIALVWDEPTERYSAGHARFVLERQFGYPVTVVRGQRLANASLDSFDVILLPGEARSYESMLGRAGVARLRSWVERGGVLIGLGTGTRFLADPDVDLLPIRLEDGVFDAADGSRDGDKKTRDDKPEAGGDGRVAGSVIADEAALRKATSPQKQAPRPAAGALARALVKDPEHWLAAGVPQTVHALVDGRDIYSPARQGEADTVLQFAGPTELLASGVLWEESRRQVAFKPFVVSKRQGRGVVVGFTQDPNFRAHLGGLNIVLLNSIFRGAALVHDANAAELATGDEEDPL